MIQIFINNEPLDLDENTLMTFKKSQELNGIQNLYSYSNNINLNDSPKNKRLLGINYLPNSKAKSMTSGYSCDVILNGCIFLKKQTLKVQKETKGKIPIYIIFTDNLFLAKSKETALNEIKLNAFYSRSSFLVKNEPATGILRTAPISAQNESGLVVVEEVNPLLNIQKLVIDTISFLGYNFEGDFFTDEKVKDYYTNANVGIYGTDSDPMFDDNLTCFNFLSYVLKTFNAFVDVSDSSKSVGFYLWKNIETIKKKFVDYSEFYTDFVEYSFEGGLAKKNNMTYNSSPVFYNGYFENNKSIVEKSDYLKSDFGAGSQRLFEDKEIEASGIILPREIGEIGEPSTLNIYRFENSKSETAIYVNGLKTLQNMYKAFSPNIFEIYTNFHLAYAKNISLPTIGNFVFKYDAIFLSKIKMQQVFFIKQLSSYWLPLELNFSTAKDKVTIKSLMIQKTIVDIPIVFDANFSLGFWENYKVQNANVLYSALNKSPQSVFLVQNFDTLKNRVFITGSDNVRTEILSFPYSIDVKTKFILEFENKDPINQIDSSDLLFQFISDDGGISRVGKINIKHNGTASFITEFKTPDNTIEFEVGQSNTPDFNYWFNQSQLFPTALDIPNALNTGVGVVNNQWVALSNYNAFNMLRKQTNIRATFKMDYAFYTCSNRGGSARAYTNVSFEIWKNNVYLLTIHSGGATDDRNNHNNTEANVFKTSVFSVDAGDNIAFFGKITGRKDRAFDADMDGHVIFKGVSWKFECTENLI